MKKIIFVICAVSTLGLFPQHVDAITTTGNSIQRGEASEPAATVAHTDTVYLLRWQDNKMLTTKGTFVTDGVEIINESGINKAAISSQKKLPVLNFNKDGNTITKITIVPHS